MTAAACTCETAHVLSDMSSMCFYTYNIKLLSTSQKYLNTQINSNREVYRLFMQSECCNAFLSGKKLNIYLSLTLTLLYFYFISHFQVLYESNYFGSYFPMYLGTINATSKKNQF